MELKVERLAGPHYEQGFLDTLSVLKPTDLTKDAFGDILRDRLARRITTFVGIVGDRVVTTAAIIIEPKFYGNVGHIEDVATHSKFGGHGFARTVIQECLDFARDAKCYKVILDCADKNVAFYEKLGFYKFESQMRMNL